MSKDEYMDQLFFSRSICISAGLLAVAWFSVTYSDGFRFWSSAILSCVQIVTFLLYVWARKDSPTEISDTNYVQLGLITTTLFVGTLFLLRPIDVSNGALDLAPIGILDKNGSALVLFVLWVLCMRTWWRLLRSLIIFLKKYEDLPVESG